MPPKYMDALGAISDSENEDSDSDEGADAQQEEKGVGGGAGGAGAGGKKGVKAGAGAGMANVATTATAKVISYEDLQARGLSRTSLLDMPVPKDEDGDPKKTTKRGADGGEEASADAADEPEFHVNAFGKWQLSRNKRAKLEAEEAEEAAARRENRGPTWGEQRGAALQAHAVGTFFFFFFSPKTRPLTHPLITPPHGLQV